MEDNVYFRNLDGTGTQHVEITPDVGTLTVTTKLTSISKADAIVIMGLDVVMTAGERVIYTLKTVFGFFPGDTMKDQAGLPMTPRTRPAWSTRATIASSSATVLRATSAARCGSPRSAWS